MLIKALRAYSIQPFNESGFSVVQSLFINACDTAMLLKEGAVTDNEEECHVIIDRLGETLSRF